MPVLPTRKVGLISCSGEELPEGTVSRMATLSVLEELRPADTVTLCLPLFLAGDERERSFARFYPTIAVDGCDKRCAARATERYSAAPAASVVVTDFVMANGLPQPKCARTLDAPGVEVAEALARFLAAEVDRLLGGRAADRNRTGAVVDAPPAEAAAAAPACACGSGIPVGSVSVNGHAVELVALPAIFELMRARERVSGAAVGDELMELVRTYNRVAAEDEAGLRAAVLCEYAAFCEGSSA